MRKTIAIAASVAVMFYLSYSAVLSATSTDISLCCYSDENKETPYTASCCCAGVDSDCCYREIPPPNETFLFFGLLDRESYRNNMCDLQMRIPDSLILAELSGIFCEERFIPKYVIYPVFRPPKV
ncbi:MAG: hypothetical protein LBH97_05260 [Treponema sp.]|jgi:hypothetical protein|nr:hypothetical protein [Treponema sp.]